MLVEFFFGHPVLPIHPDWSAYQGAQVLLGNILWRYVHHRPSAGETIFLSMPCHQCIPVSPGRNFRFGVVLSHEWYPPVDAVVLLQEIAQCLCSPSCALQQLVPPGHLKTQPCWGSIEVCCPHLIGAARLLSHKQCRGRGARMCREMEDCAWIEHSCLCTVLTPWLLLSC